jgi:hypothetical protein
MTERGSDPLFPNRVQQQRWNGNPNVVRIDSEYFGSAAAGRRKHGLYFGDTAAVNYELKTHDRFTLTSAMS